MVDPISTDRTYAIANLALRFSTLAPGQEVSFSIEALEWALGAPLDETLRRFVNPDAFHIVIDKAAGRASITPASGCGRS